MAAEARSRGPAWLRALRPRQWVKNVFVFAALVFAQQAEHGTALVRAAIAFGVFCMLSSTVYLLNDIADRESDRLHPEKRHRPIAAGELGVAAATALLVVLGLAALGTAWWLGLPFLGVASLYLTSNLAYSFGLKRVVILDVMLVASGFLLRAWAGALAVDVEMSRWLVLCTGLIALFLGFVKRRQELAAFGAAERQRTSLREYSLPFLDQMIGIVTASTVLAYSLYALSDEVAAKLHTRWMGLTIPFVLFGIFRYLYLVHQRGEGENPTALVLTDRPLIATVLLWGGTVVLVLYSA